MNKVFLCVAILTIDLLILNARAQALDRVVLQLRWDHQFQFAGYYAAQWQGYYRQEGIETLIRSAIKPDGSIISAPEAVAENAADFGIGAADILVAVDRGLPLRILASIFQKSPVEFYAKAETMLNHPADLVNLRVSRRPGDMVDVEMQAMLMAEGIDPQLVAAHPFDQSQGYMSQIQEGKVDVMPGYAIGTPHEAMRVGLDIVRLRPSDYGVDFYGDSLFTSERLISENPDLVEKFTRASLRGWEYALDHPEEIADRIIASFTPRFPIHDFDSFVHFQIEPVDDLTLHEIVAVGNVNPARWARMHTTLKTLGLVEGAFDPGMIHNPAEVRRRQQQRLKNILLLAGLSLLLLAGAGSLWIAALRRSVRERTDSLRLQKERYRALVEGSPAILYSYVPGHGGTYYSPQVSILGYTPRDLMEKPMLWHDSIHPQDLAAVDRGIRQAENGEQVEVQYRIRHRDGHWLWFFDRTYSSQLADGQTVLNGIVVDVTAKVEAEKALKESEEKWRNILINMPQLGIALNPQGRIIFVNNYFLEVTGWRQDEVLDKDWFDLFIPEKGREAIRNIFITTMSRGDTRDFSQYENDIVTRSGKRIHVSWSNLLTKDDSGRVRDVTCLGVDLTLRKTHEELLERMNTDMMLAQRMASFGFWTLDPEKGTPEWSDEVYRIYERDVEEGPLQLAEYRSIYTGKWWNRLYSAIHKAIHEGKPYELELKCVLPSGKEKWVYALGQPERKKGPHGHRLRGTIQDITDIKLAEEAVRQSQKADAVNTLAGGIAHEFNNMLGVILGNAELAAEMVPGDDPVAEHLQEIEKASLYARDVVSRLLKVAKKSPGTSRPVEIRSVVSNSLELLRKSIPKSVEIKTSFTCTDERIMGDSAEIEQILINLCTNSLHAMPEGQGVLQIDLAATTVSAETAARIGDIAPGGYAELMVRDDGRGIPEEILHRVFDPYFTTKEVDQGLGMGLAVVRGIVKKYEGAIIIASEPGKGTMVKVLLPLSEDQSFHGAAEKKKSLPKDRERILVVDDEAGIVDTVTQMLELSGYEAVGRTSSIEALKAFHIDPDHFDLVLTDMAMPVMTGEKLAEQVKKIRPDIPVILCTGYSAYMDQEQAMRRNITDFLMKPVTRIDLIESVRRALDSDTAQK